MIALESFLTFRAISRKSYFAPAQESCCTAVWHGNAGRSILRQERILGRHRGRARRYRDAIVVTREGLYPRNEATRLIPWAAIDRIILIEQPVPSGTRSNGYIIRDKSFVIHSGSMHLFRSRLGLADFLPPSRRRLPHDPTALLVIATLVRPARGAPPGYLRLLASIRRFKPVEHMVWDTSGGAWRHREK